MTREQKFGTIAVIVGVGITLAALFAGCGLTPYYKALDVAEKINIVAAQKFPDFDKAKRSQLVQAAHDKADGEQQLASWDVTADKLIKASEGIHASVILAKDGLKDVKAGVRKWSELTAWIGPVLRGATNLVALFAAVGLKLEVSNGSP